MTPARLPEFHEPEPTGFARVVAEIGEAAGDELMQVFAGRRLYVPRDPGEHHPITVAIGEVRARMLAQALGGEFVDVPLSPVLRDRILRLASEEKLGPAAIRRRLGCSRRWVFQVLAEARSGGPGDETPRLL